MKKLYGILIGLLLMTNHSIQAGPQEIHVASPISSHINPEGYKNVDSAALFHKNNLKTLQSHNNGPVIDPKVITTRASSNNPSLMQEVPEGTLYEVDLQDKQSTPAIKQANPTSNSFFSWLASKPTTDKTRTSIIEQKASLLPTNETIELNNEVIPEKSTSNFMEPKKPTSDFMEVELSPEEMDLFDEQGAKLIDQAQNNKETSITIPSLESESQFESKNIELSSIQGSPENQQKPTPQYSIENKQQTFTSTRTMHINSPLITLTHQHTAIKNAPTISIDYDTTLNATPIKTLTVNGRAYQLTKNFLNSTWTSPIIKTNTPGSTYSFELSYNPKNSQATTTIIEYEGVNPIQKTAYNKSGELQSTTVYSANELPVTSNYDTHGNKAYEPASLSQAVLNKGFVAGAKAFLNHPETQAQVKNAVTDTVNSAAAGYGIKADVESQPQEFFNEVVNKAAEHTLPIVQEYLTLPIPTEVQSRTPVLNEENQQMLHNLINTGAQIGIQKFGDVTQEYLKQNTPETTQESKPSIINEETVKIFNKTLADIKATAKNSLVDRAHQSIESKYGKPENPEVIQKRNVTKEKIGQKLAQKSLLGAEKNKITTTTPPQPVKTDTIQSYLSDRFTQSARTLSRSPQKISSFLASIGNSLSSLIKLTKEENRPLQATLKAETNNLTNNKNSFINADPRTFSVKFNTWLKSFIDKCYTAVGKKAPNNIRIISIQEQSTNSSSPRITLTTKRVNNKNEIQSAFVTYNNKSYSIDPTIIETGDDGTISITNLELFDNTKPLTLRQKLNNDLYNSTVTNSIATPLKESIAGHKIGREIIDTGADLLLAKPQQTKLLSITYTSDGSIRMQENNLVTKVASEKQYNTSGQLTSQKISLPQGLSTMMPAIEVTYNQEAFLNSNNFDPANAIDISISHTNPITNKESVPTISKQYDATTGIYRIEASYKAPESNADVIKKQVMQKMIDNKIIKEETTTATQVQTILDTVIPIMLQYPDAQYSKIIDNLLDPAAQDKNRTGASLASQIQALVPHDMLMTLKNYLQAPTPTSMQSIVVEYNPKTQQIAKTVVTRMSQGDPQQTPPTIYSLD